MIVVLIVVYSSKNLMGNDAHLLNDTLMAETVKRKRDAVCYRNYYDNHDNYEYEVSIKEEFYMKNAYEIERGVITMMYEDKLLNDRVYTQLYDDVNHKERNERLKRKLKVSFVFYLLLFIYIYLTRH